MKKTSVSLLCFFLLLCSSCKAQSASRDIFAMDTIIRIDIYGSGCEEIADECAAEVFRLEKLFSRTLDESEISVLNKQGCVEASDETVELIDCALEMRERTGGLFDITIAKVMDAWGFVSDNPAVPEQDDLERAMLTVGSEVKIDSGRISLESGAAVDLGAIAKGYTGNRLSDIVRRGQIESALIYLGGNVIAIGDNDGSPWRVAIQDPDDNTSYAGVLLVEDMHLVTSGGYERNFIQDGRLYHHIIDPATGYPADSGLKSVTIVAQDGAVADALSTAIYIMGESEAIEHWRENLDFEMVLITQDDRVLVTDGLEFEPVDGGYSYEIIYS